MHKYSHSSPCIYYIKKYISKSGKDRSTIAEELDLSYSTLTDWVNGKKYPRINNIEKIADYFNVSKSDLIEDFEEIKKDNDTIYSRMHIYIWNINSCINYI